MAVQRKFKWCLVLVLGTTLSCADPVSEKLNNPNLPKGERLFLQNCASCHGENGDLGASGAANLTTSRLDKSSILEIISLGKNGMPSFKGVINSASEMDSLVNYVSNLQQ